MIEEIQVYQLVVPVLALVTLAFAVWTLQLSKQTRLFGLAIVAMSGSFTLGYALMANGILVVEVDGELSFIGRFIGYLFAFTILYPILWAVSGASLRWLVVLLVGNFTWISSVILSWTMAEPIASIASIVNLVTFVVMVSVLLWPVAQATHGVSGERRLLYGKLKNILVLILVLYVVNGIITASGVGILDTFTGVFIGVYTDLVLLVGFSVIFLRSEEALSQVAEEIDRRGGDDDTGGSGVEVEPDEDGADRGGVSIGEANPDPAD